MVSDAQFIFSSACDGVKPDKLIFNNLKLKDNLLSIKNFRLDLRTIEHIYVIGAGKASGLMAQAVETLLGNKIDEGCIGVKYGHACQLNKINCIEAGHPIPDHNGLTVSQRIIQLAQKAQENDLVICLFSGGGSALMADCPTGIALDDLQNLSSLLLRCGANISEINAVRKHLSAIKGGNLAKIIYPATALSLFLSDVVGDSMDIIASGSTVPDTSTFQKAIEVIDKYKLRLEISTGIIKMLELGVAGLIPETPKPGDEIFLKTHNFIIGNNRTALDAALNKATKMGYSVRIITSTLTGEVEDIAPSLISQALKAKNDFPAGGPVCLLLGGEITVKVKGEGLGGRNQHLALLAACLLKDLKGITLLTAGTDGTDGPTDAAGAVVNCNTYNKAIARNVLPEKYLKDFDSYHFFEKVGGLVISGPTLTNVMDIIIILIE
ncbi:MAG: glycerate kinase [Bacteroidota bacterium]|nr:glycerate kinase [Bacteroidota bacterium]